MCKHRLWGTHDDDEGLTVTGLLMKLVADMMMETYTG